MTMSKSMVMVMSLSIYWFNPQVLYVFGTVIGKKLGWSALTPWMVEKIGTEFSVSIGGGVSPVDISFSQCTTEVKKRCKLGSRSH